MCVINSWIFSSIIKTDDTFKWTLQMQGTVKSGSLRCSESWDCKIIYTSIGLNFEMTTVITRRFDCDWQPLDSSPRPKLVGLTEDHQRKTLDQKGRSTPPQTVKVDRHGANHHKKENITQQSVDYLLWCWEYGRELLKGIRTGSRNSDWIHLLLISLIPLSNCYSIGILNVRDWRH